MSNPVFPASLPKSDSKQFSVETEDVSMKTKMDGGYVVSRAKHTRTPRKTFSTGYSMLNDAHRATLQSFYESVRGGSVIFDWIEPWSDVLYHVRFTEALNFKFAGVGNSKFWDVVLKLEQA